MTAREQLNGYMEQLERRLRLGVLLRGAAVIFAAALATTVVLVLIANALAFSKTSVAGARSLLFIIIACAIGLALALPLMRLNRKRAATTAERTFPEFQERLVTLADSHAAEREPFVELLASDTLKIARNAEPAHLVPNNRLLASLGIGAASLGVLVWLILAGPGYLGYGAALLWAGDTGSSPLYDIRVNPGNAVVRRNADLLVTAEPRGIQPDKVRIFARFESASKWEQLPMQSQAGASGFQFLFAGLPEGVEYYVEAGAVRSRHFSIRVVDLPAVKQIHVTYRYPPWTGMSASAGAPGGDLRAVEGTQADVEVSLDRPLNDGLLVLDDNRQLHLSGGAGNVYKGTVSIDKDGAYHVSALDRGQEVRISEDYFIEADKAAPPDVVIAKPGGDYRASPIEEVTISAKADDPFGLHEFSLHYSVNGGDEHTVNLLKQSGAKTGDGSTTLSLEDFKVVPGDIVSLYATAKDAHAEARTDMFFIQAEPFEREFSQSQQSAGGGGGGGGGNAPDEISQREKEIIAATWKQSGDKDAAQKASESAKFLSGVQSKLRDQALSLAGRLQMRDLTGQNAEFTDFQKDMTAAAGAMGPASEKLQQQKWKEAMPEEQKALQHLLRAEATFRQIQVAFGNAGGGGGGAGSAGRDLASLFDLELDTQKNQYEVGQTAESGAQRAKDIDEALRKLDELARRQDELASQQRNGQTSDQRWQQEMLRRQAEELQRQMEQMAKNGQEGQSQGSQGSQQGSQGSQGGSQGSQGGSQSSQNARVQQALNQLRQANDDMRRAASQQQGQADARRAAERLKEATNLMGGAQHQQSSARLDGLASEADRLANEHRSQSDRMQRMSRDQYNTGADGNYSNDVAGQQSKLAEDRQRLADDLSRMEKEMRDAVRDLSSGDRAAASKLRDALRELDQADLDTRLQRSADSIRRGVNPNYNGSESQIASGLQRLDDQVREAQKALGSGSPQNPQDAINQVQSLRNRLEALDRNFGGANRSGANSQANGEGNANGGVNNPRGGADIGANIGQYVDRGDRGYRDGAPYGGINIGNNYQLPPPVPPDTTPLPPLPPDRAYQESLRQLDQLRQTVQNDPETLSQVQKLIDEMRRLDPARFPGNPALVEQLHGQVLADVDKLELQLRRGENGAHAGEVRSGDSLPVPPGYQDAVAEYFRRLSKNP